MNKARHLFDEKYVIDLLNKKVLPMYPDFTSIKKIKIHAYKDHIWDSDHHEGTYHVVIEYQTTFNTKNGKTKKLPIICSAHSDEPRKNVYDALKFLWGSGFDKGYLTIPHPLFYSDYFRGTFYRGVEGKNLYYYIRNKNYSEIESIVTKAAKWFAKLHNLSTKNARNFNVINSRIETVLPGIPHILWRVKEDYPQYEKIYPQIYKILNNNEKKFLKTAKKLWFAHGDAHPENIIKMGTKKIAVIDFTDICLTDFARDIGTFLQQLEFMCSRKVGEKGYTDKIKKLFMDSYFAMSKTELNESVKDRIATYYHWTAMRTATFFLIKDEAEPERAYPMIEKVRKDMGIKK